MFTISQTLSWQTKNHRTEIWKKDQKLGSINSYNNKFTQFFANLFKKTIIISLNNEKRVFNKKSYMKFINDHPQNSSDLSVQREKNQTFLSGAISKNSPVRHLPKEIRKIIIGFTGIHELKERQSFSSESSSSSSYSSSAKDIERGYFRWTSDENLVTNYWMRRSYGVHPIDSHTQYTDLRNYFWFGW